MYKVFLLVNKVIGMGMIKDKHTFDWSCLIIASACAESMPHAWLSSTASDFC